MTASFRTIERESTGGWIIEDVLAYKQQRDLERDAKLDELAELSEEIGGYDEAEGSR